MARWMSVRSSTECPFRYVQMCGCNVFVCSIACASVFDIFPDIYASSVSSSDIGLRSVRESGFGIGILCVCFAAVGSSLCMSMNCMICSIICFHMSGSLPNMFSVKPPFRAFFVFP